MKPSTFAPTPRTDALSNVPMTRYDSDEFARSLERDNARLTAQNAALVKTLARLVKAQEASREKFTAREIDEIEAAMIQANAVLAQAKVQP